MLSTERYEMRMSVFEASLHIQYVRKLNSIIWIEILDQTFIELGENSYDVCVCVRVCVY